MVCNAVTNVIEFPVDRRMKDIKRKKMETEGFSIKLFSGSLDELQTYSEYENDVDALMENLLADLYEMGYDVQDDSNTYDISFMFETIRSLVFKFAGDFHPLQSFAENVYTECLDTIENEKQLEFDFQSGDYDAFTACI